MQSPKTGRSLACSKCKMMPVCLEPSVSEGEVGGNKSLEFLYKCMRIRIIYREEEIDDVGVREEEISSSP